MGLGSNHCEHDIDENYCHICRDEIIQVQSVEIEQLKAVAIAAKTVLRDALDRVDVRYYVANAQDFSNLQTVT